MHRGLVDRDIVPTDRLVEQVASTIEVEIGGTADEEILIDELADANVVFTTSRLPLTERVIDQTDLDIVAKIGTGVDNVALDAARERGIPVTYTPGTNAIAVAEHTIGLVLAVSKQFETGRRALQTGRWRDEVPLGRLINGKTLGIVGYGDIGSRVASLMSGFHTEILAHDPYIDPIDTEYAGASLVPLDDLLTRSDIVSINAELTEETRGMIGHHELSLMQDHAIIVNTARGPIIQQDALIEALDTGAIAGAGLDVFEHEPPTTDSPLHDYDSVIMTPHVAGVTVETRERAIQLLANNVRSLLEGDQIPTRYLATA